MYAIICVFFVLIIIAFLPLIWFFIIDSICKEKNKNAWLNGFVIIYSFILYYNGQKYYQAEFNNLWGHLATYSMQLMYNYFFIIVGKKIKKMIKKRKTLN